jgi:hypothetical protein
VSSRPRPFIPYDIPLGEGERARLALPHDLSQTEADRICGVIQTLAFSDEALAAAAEEAATRAASLGALMADWAAEDAP